MDEQIEALCLKRIQKLDVPSTGQFHYSVRQVATSPRAYRAAVCATAKAMIGTDRKIHVYETEVLEHLLRKLRPLQD